MVLCLHSKTAGKFLHSALCILHSSGALRRVERVEGNKKGPQAGFHPQLKPTCPRTRLNRPRMNSGLSS